MPLYDYKCKDCETTFEKSCKIVEMDEPKECPSCKSMNSEKFIGGAPAFGDPFRMGITRPDQGFKEVLQRIHEKTPGSILNQTSRYL